MSFSPLQTLLLTGPTFAFGIWMLWIAKREGSFALLTFAGMMLYAFGLEFSAVHTTRDYSYSQLLPMIGSGVEGVPIEVTVSWAVILTCCMRTSDQLALNIKWRPLFDGLMAVALDFVLDPVLSASRAVPALGPGCLSGGHAAVGGLGMWIWCVPPSIPAFWLNVPLINFVGWIFFVAALSHAVRTAQAATIGKPLGQMAWTLLRNLVVALLAVTAFLLLFKTFVTTATAQRIVLGIGVAIPLVITLAQLPKLRMQNAIDRPVVLFVLTMIPPYGALFYWRGQAGAGTGDGVMYAAAIAFALVLTLAPYARGVSQAP
jgi:hypothetical protein